MPSRRTDPPDDRDRLSRREAGVYVTADERFEVRETDGAWYLLDREQDDELGQSLTRGPFGTRRDAAAEIASARKISPARRKQRR
jgi:hypothetical protein